MRSASFNLLLFWHGLFAGAYIVAFASGDDDFMGMHIAAGWMLIGLGFIRLLVAVFMPETSPWSLPWPNPALIKAFRRHWEALDAVALFQGRNLMIVMSGLVVLTVSVLASFSGYLPGDDLHEGIANFSLMAVLAHGALILISQGMKKLKATPPSEPPAKPKPGRPKFL
ncbi:MAG: hypothetical protein HQL45_14685 [Alphaproteobacteria bacterium]|nr:hypothetical protein [Alphaproteobacteria bacterium]